MSVSAVQTDTSSLLSSLSASTGASSSTKELSDRFLTLLVTQLKNQDPMNPMENAELTSQLAQLSTVEEIGKLNQSMTAFVDQFKASQSLQAAALLGRQVLTDGDALRLGSEGAVGAADLKTAADKVTVKVLNADGLVLRGMDLGAQPAGLMRFVWDGLDQQGQAMPLGQYQFAVEASRAGEPVANSHYALGQVMSVTLNESSARVEVAGAGDRDLSQIRQIY